MAREIRVGLVGYEFMGRAHSAAYAAAPRLFDLDAVPVLAAICGRNQDAVRAAATRWGWQSTETSWEKLVARDDIDLVDIATPNDLHYDVAMAALKAGKAVVCEKPLALDAAQAYRMANEAYKRGLPNMVWFHVRRCPAVGLARRLIDEGRLGRLRHVRATYLQDWLVDPAFPLAWRLRKEAAGSGAHGDLNAHLIDLVRFLVGEFIEVVGHAQTFVAKRPMPSREGKPTRKGGRTGKVTVDDATLFLANIEGGVVGSFEATRFAAGRRNHSRIEINGSEGSLVWSLERMDELEFYGGLEPEHARGFRTIRAAGSSHPHAEGEISPGSATGYGESFVSQVADLMHGLAHGTTLIPSFEDGLRCQETLDAVMTSAAERCWVRVPRKRLRRS